MSSGRIISSEENDAVKRIKCLKIAKRRWQVTRLPLFLISSLLLQAMPLLVTEEMAHAQMQGTVAPFIGQAAPVFSLPDSDGKQRGLKDYRGRPVTLYFFCGCPWCSRCAHQWGLFQRSGSLNFPAEGLSSDEMKVAPITLIVFTGEAASARVFADQAGLDLKQTVLLPDPAMQVAQVYRADPCPRVFVISEQGILRYTNNHSDDAGQTAPALVIASRTLNALRALTNTHGQKQKSQPIQSFASSRRTSIQGKKSDHVLLASPDEIVARLHAD